jgi:hypothetical protein
MLAAYYRGAKDFAAGDKPMIEAINREAYVIAGYWKPNPE